MVHYTTASLALSALALLGSSAVVNAHYVLTSPLTRGFSDDDEPTVPCGGFDSPVNPVAFPLKSSVSISAFHSAATVNVSIKIGDAADFTQVTSVKVDFGKVDPCSNIPPWNSTIPVDLSKLKGATAGAKAVIQTVFDGPDGALYQCAGKGSTLREFLFGCPD
ncbi:hypothetical protein DFJ73DRAFT_813489 [Zopfochytrium polystomum]|nr:hypothetical protein DFJ73DRAFT_813489 [Zopfochytrium polystomum]